ncbi:hypothetical protein MXB_1759 [Myxobolus squamalis]|nr:hypothetical protein MXB_1759 [Myxobolus squamalis]
MFISILEGPNHPPFILKIKLFPALQDNKFPFTLNKDLCITADGNSFVLLKNFANIMGFYLLIWRFLVRY